MSTICPPPRRRGLGGGRIPEQAMRTWLSLVALTALFLCGCGKQPAPPNSKVPRPHVGDRAVVRVSTILRYDMMTGPLPGQPPLRWRKLLVKCIASEAHSDHFAVYYTRKGKHVLAYYFKVDYAATALDRRTVVTDPRGRFVLRGELVDGYPVPFQDFLSYARDHPAEITSRSGMQAVLRNHLASNGHLSRLDVANDAKAKAAAPWLQENQYWSYDQWLWSKCEFTWGTEKRTQWTAIRLDPPVRHL